MLTFAIEQSTCISSIALLDGVKVVAEHSWNDHLFRNQYLFSIIPDLFSKASMDPADVDMFAVGLGPGSFSGLRISLSVARAIALPGEKKVLGISSGEALAWDIFCEKKTSPIVVVGDARRNRLWFAQFSAGSYGQATDDLLNVKTPFSLIKIEELPGMLEKHSIIVTPDWDRIGEELRKFDLTHTALIEEKRVPQARTVGKLAFRKTENNHPSELLRPIYLHPPVSVNSARTASTRARH